MPLATSDYAAIARTLDNKRLHKQALEAWQILMVLVELNPDGVDRKPTGWVNHPATKMWRNREQALLLYILAMVVEWHERGYKSTIGEKAIQTYLTAVKRGKADISHTPLLPSWQIDNDEFEKVAGTHRQALLAKNYAHYSQFGWQEDNGIEPTTYEYYWPTPKADDDSKADEPDESHWETLDNFLFTLAISSVATSGIPAQNKGK
jgi:hypothetical protein